MSHNKYLGIVQKGEARGKALGYPTANILAHGPKLTGIYAARVHIRDHESAYMAAAYADERRGVLEAHILDFNDDLYGIPITVELYKKIREGKRFENDEALRAAIATDIEDIREYFKNI